MVRRGATTAALLAIACWLPPATAMAATTAAGAAWRMLTGAQAAEIDARLMSTPGFQLAQLMELAGLAVATAVHRTYPPPSTRRPRVLVVCGSGNNGGDGLVAARHLSHFRYDPVVVLPRPRKPRVSGPGDIDPVAALFDGLLAQLADLDIPIQAAMPVPQDGVAEASITAGGAGAGEAGTPAWDIVVDAVFGFSFAGAPRPPFDAVIAGMVAWQRAGVPIVSVDVPSGWDVEEGDVHATHLLPDTLISLTAPKRCARYFTGRHHWLGGRFIPHRMAVEYGLHTGLPPYPGSDQIVRLT